MTKGSRNDEREPGNDKREPGNDEREPGNDREGRYDTGWGNDRESEGMI